MRKSSNILEHTAEGIVKAFKFSVYVTEIWEKFQIFLSLSFYRFIDTFTPFFIKVSKYANGYLFIF